MLNDEGVQNHYHQSYDEYMINTQKVLFDSL